MPEQITTDNRDEQNHAAGRRHETHGVVPSRAQKAQRELRLFWVLGTAGAFFAGLADHIPADLEHIGERFSAILLIRYLYALWLLAYFFISNFGILEEHSFDWRDLINDIVQAVAGLTAVYFLGFGYSESSEPFKGLIAANTAILIICLFTFVIFQDKFGARVNILRAGGVFCAMSGFGITVFRVPPGPNAIPSHPTLYALLTLQAFLYLILGYYFWMCWTQEETYRKEPFSWWNRAWWRRTLGLDQQ